jgi:hypothetical protein
VLEYRIRNCTFEFEVLKANGFDISYVKEIPTKPVFIDLIQFYYEVLNSFRAKTEIEMIFED